MTQLLTTTGMALLVGIGSMALPAPPRQAGGGGGGEPPPAPPVTTWYDTLWAKRNGVGVGARVTSFTDDAVWDAATSGVSISGGTASITGSDITADGVDFTGTRILSSGANARLVDCKGTAVNNGTGIWRFNGANPVIEWSTMTNPTNPTGEPPIFFQTISSGVCTVRDVYIEDTPTDAIRGPNPGALLVVQDCVLRDLILRTGAHVDFIDLRGADPGSSIRRVLFYGDHDPRSVSETTPSTGYTNTIRCAPSDGHGGTGAGVIMEELIMIGSNDPGNDAVLLSPNDGDGAGVVMYDLLIDLREHNNLMYSSVRCEDWYARSFSAAQAEIDGFITPGAEIPFPNLAAQPAAVPSQMVAPVLTAVPGGFTYAAMARPFNQRSTITGYTLEWSTNGTAWTQVAADLAGGFVATGAASSVRARVYATNGIGNSTVSPASNILPTISAASVALTALPFDGFVFDAASTDSAVAVLSGTATPGAYVEARGEGTVSTPWVETTADGSGNWTVFLTINANAGEWYTPAARISGSDATKVTGANKFAGGDVVTFGPAQSELEYMMNTGSFYNANPYPTLLAQNLTMLTLQGTGGTHTARRITTAAVNQVNVAMVALANLFHRARPGRKLLIIDQSVSGQGRQALHNDADTGFYWSDLLGPATTIRNAGGEIGHVIECWYNANAATIKTFGTSWAPFYMGQRWGGGAFTLGTPNPDAGAGNVDHCLWDIEATADDYGRGLYKRSRTKLHLLTPMPFHDTLTTEQRNFTTKGDGSSTNNRIQNLDRPARDTLDAFAADSRVQTFLAAVGPSAHVVDFGGGIHPLPADPYGTPQFAMLFAPAVLRASGYTISEPVIDHAAVSRGAAGAYADVPVTLPNGGTLTTIRALRSIAAPGTEPPHYQPVVGFEIRRAADTDAERRPVMKTTETGYPSAYRGTVTIQDAGSGTGSARRGVVRITPTDAFATGDMIEYLRGEASGHIIEPRDVTARLFLDMLIEHIPGLYYPADTYPYCGVPVKPQPPMMTLA